MTTRLGKLEALLRRDLGIIGEAAPLIAGLLDLDPDGRYPPTRLSPQQQRSRTLALLVEQLLGVARRQPVLMVLEDAQWADPTTLKLVEQLLEAIGSEHVLLLATVRPEDQASIGSHPSLTRLTPDFPDGLPFR